MSSECKHKNWFCFVCGHFTPQSNRRNIGETVETAYLFFFGKQFESQRWIPEIICTTCESRLCTWLKGGDRYPKYSEPMTWFPVNQHVEENCYFCRNFKPGRNAKYYTEYEQVNSVILPIDREQGVPPPIPPQAVPEGVDFNPISRTATVDTGPSNVPSTSHSEYVPPRYVDNKPK